MKSGRYRGLLAITGIASAGLLLSSTMLLGSQQSDYRRRPIRQEFTIPPAQTEMTLMIEAYERLINQYAGLAESAQRQLQADVDGVGRKLEAIDRKISLLSAQVETIQKKLGIEPLKQQQTLPVSALQEPANTEAPAENH
ncbi:MAG: hypothetical protein KBI46_00380 [Phycisphaerae bacterium]|nr:hypothetical protein [Phycisphaerae bacterium]